jgi:septal ring factor EnvC (AmiA/AmiB activator)
MRALAVAFALVLAATAPVSAQAPAPVAPPSPERIRAIEAERAERMRQLDSIGGEIRLSDDQVRRIEQEIETLRRDREEISRQLVRTAETVQRTEALVDAGEQRLLRLRQEETMLRHALASRRAVLAEVLGALQRLGRNPPPALVVEPRGTLEAVRSAILLGAVLPEMRGEVERVVADLERLARVRTAIDTEMARRRDDLAALAQNRTRLDLLMDSKRRAETTSAEDLARTRARAEQLARDARSLRDLVTAIERDVAAARRAAEDAARADRERATAEREAEESRQAALLRRAPEPAQRTLAALPNAGRIQPAIAFERTRGLLPLPVSGEIVRGFGDDDAVGGSARGLSLATRPNATVTSPSDGWIVYAGPFRSYGHIIIVNVGQGHHVLLAGMERVTVDTGQFVLAGEPVGRMGETILATATALDVGSDRPVLYVEFRKDGSVIDPTPWWARAALEKARG